MKLKMITLSCIASMAPINSVLAAAMDRSGQSIYAFLQPDNYFETGISILDPNVKGQEAGLSETHRQIDNMGEDYLFPNAAMKLQLTDKISFGLLYDQPFGADAAYSGENHGFVSSDTDTILPQSTLNGLIEKSFSGLSSQQRVGLSLQAKGIDITSAAGQQILTNTLTAYNANPVFKEQIDTAVENSIVERVNSTKDLLGKGQTKVEVDTQSLSMIFGYQPNKQFNIFGGGVYQTIKGNVNLRGQAYSLFNGYDTSIKETGGVGWLAGLAYQIPEISLKAAITYRSKINHKVDMKENIPTLQALSLLGMESKVNEIASASSDTTITTPQSINLDLQTGIMADTVAFANIRWVNWKDFTVRPAKFGLISETIGKLPQINKPQGFDLIKYSEDQISANIGVGRKLSDQWAGNISIGWDSGAGNPVTTLGPTNGYWNVGLGIQYNPTPSTLVATGIKYFWLGDAKSQSGAQADTDDYIAEFKDNDAIAYGLKIGYKF